MTPDGPQGPRKPKTVPVDIFAPCDLAREYRLTPHEAWILTIMALQKDYWSNEWVGTYTYLHSASRVGRKSVAKAVEGLVEKGLLELVEPFKNAAEGRVIVVVGDTLVPVKRRARIASNGANGTPIDRANFAPTSRLVRDEVASNDANEQGKGDLPEVKRHRGEEVVRAGGFCEVCGEPNKGHPFSDHEPTGIKQVDGTWEFIRSVVPS